MTAHPWRLRVFDLDPASSAAGNVTQAESLRDDALAPEHTSLPVDDHTIGLAVGVKHDPSTRPAQHLRQRTLARFDRSVAQVLAVELKQVEGAQQGSRLSVRLRRSRSNTASPLWSQAMASPSIRHERTLNPAIAAAIIGNLPAKSYPLRVTSRTSAPLRWAMIRNPSCLIS